MSTGLYEVTVVLVVSGVSSSLGRFVSLRHPSGETLADNRFVVNNHRNTEDRVEIQNKYDLEMKSQVYRFFRDQNILLLKQEIYFFSLT